MDPLQLWPGPDADSHAWSVLADALLAQGDPRGALMAGRRRLARPPFDPHLQEEVDALEQELEPVWPRSIPRPVGAHARWTHGFLEGITLRGMVGDADAATALANARPPRLRHLQLHYSPMIPALGREVVTKLAEQADLSWVRYLDARSVPTRYTRTILANSTLSELEHLVVGSDSSEWETWEPSAHPLRSLEAYAPWTQPAAPLPDTLESLVLRSAVWMTLESLALWSGLSRLRTLSLYSRVDDPDVWERLAGALDWDAMTRVELHVTEPSILYALHSVPNLTALQALHLYNPSVETITALTRLVTNPTFALQALYLHGGDFQNYEAMEHLLQLLRALAAPGTLQALHVRRAGMWSASHLQSLVRSRIPEQLRELVFDDCLMNGDPADSLTTCTWPNLQVLDLQRTRALGEPGLIELFSAAAQFPELQELNVGPSVTSLALRRLAEAPLPNLRRLSVKGRPSPDGCAWMASAAWVHQLEQLTLHGVAVGAEAGALLGGPRLQHATLANVEQADALCEQVARQGTPVRKLQLWGSDLSATGAAALARSDGLTRLQRLDITNTSNVGDEGLRILGHAGWLEQLHTIEIYNVGASLTAAREFEGVANRRGVYAVTTDDIPF